MIYILLFAALVFIKICIFSFLTMNPQVFFSGGNDGDYYDAYARGADLVTSSVWPDVLRGLNEFGLYSRQGVSFALMILGVIVIPMLVVRLSTEQGAARNRNISYLALVMISVYPTLFYYTLDIYRDVAMLFVFLLGLWAVRQSFESDCLSSRLTAAVMVLLLGGVLFLLRGYLGFAFLIAFLGCRLVAFRRFGLFTHVVPILLVLNFFFALGYLQPLMKYRSLFDAFQGGSDLGIRFDTVYEFIPDFLLNFFGQFLGFFFPSFSAVVLFFLESLPFCIGLIYLLRNRRYANKFVDFIYVFSVVYALIWLLGNDNLGTATRLRMYNYVGVLIACFIVYQRKAYFIQAASLRRDGSIVRE
ncbi:hypothetical protein [Pseudomonas sp. CAM1A]|uniref:hypothetical protein n=1 Tax=Pseudomonas sp. CAM1A TaxID=3231717 RepID=UPI0039C714C3